MTEIEHLYKYESGFKLEVKVEEYVFYRII